jgi:hypothetical protein
MMRYAVVIEKADGNYSANHFGDEVQKVFQV